MRHGGARNGEEDWIQNFRVIFEGLLEILQGCEESEDVMLGGVAAFVFLFFLRLYALRNLDKTREPVTH